MIELPKSLKLNRDIRDENALLQAAKDWLEKDQRAEGIHASDLLDLRQAYYRHTDPRGLSSRETTLFLVGKVLHAFVLGSRAGEAVDLAKTDEGSRYSEELGLWYSPDWDKGEVAEFKTSRVFKEPKTIGDVDVYLEQVLVYMAAKNVTEAKLWVLLINLKTDDNSRRTVPAFRCYKISISPEDLEQAVQYIRGQRDILDTAIRDRRPDGLPVCRAWKCGEGNCPYWGNPCKPEGRYEKDDPSDWEQ